MEPRTVDTAGMNPERAAMLRSIAAGASDCPSPSDHEGPKVGPRVSGANLVRLCQPRRLRIDNRRPKDSADLPTSRMGDACGARDVEELVRLPLAPAPNRHTAFLSSLLQRRVLRLTLEQRTPGECVSVAKMHLRYVSDAGLSLNDRVRARSNLPMLRLPRPVPTDLRRLPPDGSINQVARGTLLEEAWPGLAPEAKFSIAGQLRQLVDEMRKTAQGVVPRILGSAFSGQYSLLMEEIRGTTYFAVQISPTHRQFIAFLIATLHPGVPISVVTSIAAQFGLSGRLVLSHCELSPQNIIVDQGKIVGIIGWDHAGWYPEWWEYVKFFEAQFRHRDWYNYADTIFSTKFASELTAYQALMRSRG